MEKLYGVKQPMVGSIASVIRDEVQQALHSHRYPQMPNVVPTDAGPAPMFAHILPCKFVLDHLGLSVEAYYASEVDKDAIHVGLTRHGSSITYLGPVEQLTDQQVCMLFQVAMWFELSSGRLFF
ncbi:hypothetical protein HPB49_010765 [Dermacentor silvarum]|uniref:Uncharacterized protein n=1 Tax=Dermacentor silvarum TaxID=543639 RepID=A0ACB8DZ73_DERSI|nr:hypothetical protein HPB49_010765 [Dermacentor silvarum]